MLNENQKNICEYLKENKNKFSKSILMGELKKSGYCDHDINVSVNMVFDSNQKKQFLHFIDRRVNMVFIMLLSSVFIALFFVPMPYGINLWVALFISGYGTLFTVLLLISWFLSKRFSLKVSLIVIFFISSAVFMLTKIVDYSKINILLIFQGSVIAIYSVISYVVCLKSRRQLIPKDLRCTFPYFKMHGFYSLIAILMGFFVFYALSFAPYVMQVKYELSKDSEQLSTCDKAPNDSRMRSCYIYYYIQEDGQCDNIESWWESNAPSSIPTSIVPYNLEGLCWLTMARNNEDVRYCEKSLGSLNAKQDCFADIALKKGDISICDGRGEYIESGCRRIYNLRK